MSNGTKLSTEGRMFSSIERISAAGFAFKGHDIAIWDTNKKNRESLKKRKRELISINKILRREAKALEGQHQDEHEGESWAGLFRIRNHNN